MTDRCGRFLHPALWAAFLLVGCSHSCAGGGSGRKRPDSQAAASSSARTAPSSRKKGAVELMHGCAWRFQIQWPKGWIVQRPGNEDCRFERAWPRGHPEWRVDVEGCWRNAGPSDRAVRLGDRTIQGNLRTEAGGVVSGSLTSYPEGAGSAERLRVRFGDLPRATAAEVAKLIVNARIVSAPCDVLGVDPDGHCAFCRQMRTGVSQLERIKRRADLPSTQTGIRGLPDKVVSLAPSSGPPCYSRPSLDPGYGWRLVAEPDSSIGKCDVYKMQKSSSAATIELSVCPKSKAKAASMDNLLWLPDRRLTYSEKRGDRGWELDARIEPLPERPWPGFISVRAEGGRKENPYRVVVLLAGLKLVAAPCPTSREELCSACAAVQRSREEAQTDPLKLLQ